MSRSIDCFSTACGGIRWIRGNGKRRGTRLATTRRKFFEPLEGRVPLAADFGDAPDTGAGTAAGNYKTLGNDNGPSHTVVAGLRMGASVDMDDGTLQNATANADDVNQGLPDDEDGLNNPAADLTLTHGTQPTVNVIVTNTTGSTAMLSAWIDYNNDGVFDNATERAQAAVASGTTGGIVLLTFPTVSGGFTGTTYARFRLSTDAAAANSIGAASDGEVEDYLATITIPGVGMASSTTKIASDTGGGPTLAAFDQFGVNVSSLGDLDGDGVTDLAVGAHGDDTGGSNRGAVHVLFLNTNGTVKSSQKIAHQTGGGPALADDERFGVSVSSLGDLDGDGVSDLAVGAHHDDIGGSNRGAVHVLFMNTDGTVKSSQKIAHQTGGGPSLADDLFGISVSALGDLDGDGVSDLAVGAVWDDTGGSDRGAVYVLFMNTNGTVKSSQKIAHQTGGGATLADFDFFGHSVSSLGDLDGDGASDLAVGTWNDDTGGNNRGAVYVLLLNSNGTVKSSQKIAHQTGGGPTLADRDNFGKSVSSLGDLDGDGVTDLAVGAHRDDTGGSDRGAVHVLLMNTDGTVKSSQKIAHQTSGGPTLADGDIFGGSVSSLGDLDGDGVSELAVGAFNDDTGGNNRGAVYVLFLTPRQITINDVTVTEGDASIRFVDEFVPSDGSFPERPWDIIRGPSGDFYASTAANEVPSGVTPSSIVRIDGDTGAVDADFVPVGTGGLDDAREIAISGDWLYVGNKGTNEILRFDLTTGTPDPNGPFVSSGDNGLKTPRGLIFDTAGNLYFSSNGTDRILKYDPAGNFLGFFAPAFSFPSGGRGPFDLAFDNSGDMYVGTDNRVLKFDGDGNYLSDFVAAGAGGLERAVNLTFGPEGDLYVTNATFGTTRQILQFDGQSGAFGSIVANSNDSLLQGLAFDEAGNLYTANSLPLGGILRYARSSSAAFTVSLSPPSDLPVTVNFDTADVTATAGSDYTASSGTLVFAPGVTTRTIIVPTVEDAEIEPDETFAINLSSPSAGATIADSQGLGTIVDATPGLSIDDVTVLEGDNTLRTLDTFIAEGSGGLARPRSLIFGPDGNGDGADDLYVSSVDTDEILRYDGQNGDFIDAFVAAASVLEDPSGLQFSPVNGHLYVSSTATHQIHRFDGQTGAYIDTPVSGLARPLGLTFANDGSLLIANQDTDEVLRYDGSSLSAFISAGSGGLDRPRNAVFGPDGNLYVASSNTKQVLRYDGATGAFIDVFSTLQLSSGPNWIEFGTDGILYATSRTTETCCDNSLVRIDSTSGSVIDSFALGRDGWSFVIGPGNVIYNLGNGFGNFVNRIRPASLVAFTVNLSAASGQPVTVDFATSNGTATVPDDYTAASGTLTFAPGVTSLKILVPTIDDTETESDETFFVNLANPTGGAGLADGQAVGTIQDDETPRFSIDDAAVTEGDESIRFIDAFVSAGSGGLNAPGDLVLGPDGNLYVSSKQSDSVLRYDAATGEFIDTFVPSSAGLDNPQGLLFGTDGNLYVTSRLTDEVLRYNGTTGAFIDAFVTAGSGGLENPVELTFGVDGKLYVSSRNTDEVLRYDGTTGEFIGAFVTVGSGGLDAPHDLVFGPDGNLYVASQNTDSVLRYDGTTGAFIDEFIATGSGGLNGLVHMVFGPGGDLYVGSALSDSVLRYDGTSGAFLEAYVVAGSGGLDRPLGLLFDADGNLYVSSRDTHEVLRYGVASQAVFTVSLSLPRTLPVTVNFDTADGTATAGSDYTATNGTVQFDAGVTSRTILVPTINDTEDEPDETFFVNLSNPTGGAAITDGQGQGTILNDDAAAFLSIDDVTIAEGNSGTTSATFTVTLSPAISEIVTVNYATSDGTATAGSDYQPTTGQLTFAPNQTQQTIIVPVIGDLDVDGDETFFVDLFDPTIASLADSQGLGTILGEEIAYPGQLENKQPLGSLIYNSLLRETISTPGEVQNRSIDLDDRQTVTLVVDAAPGLRVNVELLGPAGTPLAAASAAAAGGRVVLGPVATAGSGTHAIVISGLAGTTGDYTARLILNAAVEHESNGGPSNNGFSAAQDINGSFIELDSGGSQRGAVLGTADGEDDTVGPDRFGHEATIVPFEFQNIRSAGTPVLTDVDDGSVELTVANLDGFSFDFYGKTYESLFVSSNGLLTFEAASDAFENSRLASLPLQAAIAPLWDDLDTRGAADGVYWEVRGGGDKQTLIVQWNDVLFFDSPAADPITFQAILHETDGTFQFNYLDTDGDDPARDGGASATVGIKAPNVEGDDLLVSHNTGSNPFVGTGQSLRFALPSGAGPAEVLGPDGFGYQAVSREFEFENIAGTGTVILSGADNDSIELTAGDLNGFAFEFYGPTYSSLFVSSNGLITFGSASNSASNTDLSVAPAQTTIAALWDDWVIEDSNAVQWEVRGSGDNQRLIVQWNDVNHIDNFGSSEADLVTFQAILRESDGSVQLNYLDLALGDPSIDNGAAATVGIKAAGSQGDNRLLLSLNDASSSLIGSGKSVLIARGLSGGPPPDFYGFDLTAGDSASLALSGLTQGALQLELYDSNANLLASGRAAQNVDLVIPNVAANVTGTYYARVAGRAADYSLVVTRNAAFDSEPNSELAEAQELPVQGRVLGYLNSQADRAPGAVGRPAARPPFVGPLQLQAVDNLWDSSGDRGDDHGAELTDDDGPSSVRLIVRFADSLDGARKSRVLAQYKGQIVRELPLIDGALISLPGGASDLHRAASVLASDPAILYAEPDFEVHALATIPNDPSFGRLWGLHNTGQTGGLPDADIDAPEAWDIFTGSSSVVVASIDTGVDYLHPDLAANMWINAGEIPGDGIDNDDNGFIDDIYGIDTANDDSDPLDDDGHGSHTSGTIGAVGDNGVGVAGVNWGVQIMALKFLSATGSGSTSDAIDAISYMTMMKTEYGVNIVASNNSWSGGGFSQALEDAIQASNDAGIMFVAAAGNSNSDNDANPQYPATYDLDGIISVAATDHNDLLASFSSFGATTVDLGAPGVDTLSTLPGDDYGSFSGTSMSAPHVAGAVAMLMAHNPDATLEQVKAAILDGTDPIDALTDRAVSGGRLNLANSLALIGDRGDYYQLPVTAGNALVLTTSTPGAASGEFMNAVDPAIELYDPAGALVAFNDNSAADGRNARLAHTATTTGSYTVRVLSAGGRGEYVLNASGQTGDAAAYEGIAVRPADGVPVAAPPATVTVDFTDSVLLTSVEASDLTVGGAPAIGVTAIDGDTLRFDLPSLAEGTHTASIEAGAIADLQGTPIEPLSSQLTVDLTAPRVIGSSVLDGDVVPAGALTFTLQFDEPLRDDHLDTSYVLLTGEVSGTHEPTVVGYDAGTSTLTLEFDDLEDDALTLRLSGGDGGFEDLAGNDLDGEGTTLPSGDSGAGGDFVVRFSVDVSETAAAPFERLKPLGGLMFVSQDNQGLIHAASDIDQFTFFAQAGQTVTAHVVPSDAAATLTIDLVDSSGASVAGPIVASAPGAPVVLPVMAIDGTGDFGLRVSASATTTYQLSVGLNLGGESPGNDSSNGAEIAIDGSLTSVSRFGAVGTSRPTSVELESVLWGAQPSTGMILSLDPATGEVLHQFAAPGGLMPGHTQIGLSIADEGNSLLYINSDVDPSRLYRLDPITGAVLSIETTDGLIYDGLGFESAPRVVTTIYAANMASDPGWTLEGDWAYGTPVGGGSENGDPTSGFTGSNVIGYNLAGDYANNLSVAEFAVTPPIDASQYSNVTLSFQRWLGVEGFFFDEASIEVSNDGIQWSQVWNSALQDVQDDEWTFQTFDISQVADGQSTVLVRWGMGPSDEALPFPGWNLDDVVVTGVRKNSPTIFLGQENSAIRAQLGYSGAVTNHVTLAAPSGAAGGDDAGRQFAFVPGAGIVEYHTDAPQSVIRTLPAPASDLEGLAFDGSTLYASTASGTVHSLDPDSGAILTSVSVAGGGLFGLGANGTTRNLQNVVFAEDFDGPTTSFTLDNTFGSGGGLWHVSTGRQLDGLPHHTPPGSLYFGRGEKDFGGGSYETGSAISGQAVSPVIHLPLVAPITLTFNTLIDTERSYDQLEVVIDDGTTQSTLLSTFGSELPASTSGIWQEVSRSLSGFAGKDIQIRFVFDADDSVNDFEGAYIDDIVITVGGGDFDFTVPDVDEFTMDLSGQAGRTIDVLLAGQDFADFSSSLLELVDVDGSTVLVAAVPDALGQVSSNYDLGVLDFVLPADGIYTLRMTSIVDGDYTITVADSLLFDTELDDELDGSIRSLADGTSALGFVGQDNTGGRLFVVEDPENPADPGTIHELDPESGAILNSFLTPNVPGTSRLGINLALDDENLWYNAGLFFGDNRIYRLNPDDGSVVDIRDGAGDPLFAGLARVGRELFAVDGAIHVYDAGEPSYPLSRVFASPDFFSVGLAGNDAAGTLFLVSQGFDSGRLYELDAKNGQVLRAVPLASEFYEQGLAVVGDELFVSESGDEDEQQEIAVYDLQTLALVRRMNVTLTPGAGIAGVGGDGFAGEGSDYYSVELTAGEQLTISTQTPFDDVVGSPLNNLDPALTLYDVNDEAVATDSSGQGDGKNARLVFTATLSGNYRLEVSSEGGAGEYVLETEIQPAVTTGFVVTALVPTSTGFVAQFGGDLDTSSLNLSGTQAGELGPSDLVVTGASTGAVRGSLVLDPTGDSITFVKTGARLAADTYTVTLRSADNGFKDTAGNLLDGDSNGVAGDDFTDTFTIETNTIEIAVPDFVRGAGQELNLPANSTDGIPVSISDGTGVRNATFSIDFDANLLSITAATVGANMPAGATATLDTSTPGRAVVTFTGATDLPPGANTLVHLQANVPVSNANAIYGDQHVLDIHGITITNAAGAELPAVDNDGLHVAAFLADVSGNGRINASDAAQVARVAALLDDGFAATPLTDPRIVGDVSGNGRINAADASLVARFAALIDVPEIPPIPSAVAAGGAGAGSFSSLALPDRWQDTQEHDGETNLEDRSTSLNGWNRFPNHLGAVDALMEDRWESSVVAGEEEAALVFEEALEELFAGLDEHNLLTK